MDCPTNCSCMFIGTCVIGKHCKQRNDKNHCSDQRNKQKMFMFFRPKMYVHLRRSLHKPLFKTRIFFLTSTHTCTCNIHLLHVQNKTSAGCQCLTAIWSGEHLNILGMFILFKQDFLEGVERNELKRGWDFLSILRPQWNLLEGFNYQLVMY